MDKSNHTGQVFFTHETAVKIHSMIEINLRNLAFAFSTFLSALVLSGCSLFSSVDTRRKEIPVVQEVPFQAREGEDLRKKILVLPFIDSELNRSQRVTDVARQVVVEDLVNSKQFIVIDNSDLGQDVKSFLKSSNEYDMVALSRLAAQVGAVAVVEGRVLEIRARRVGDEIGLFRKVKAQVDATVQIRMFGAKSTREIYNDVRKATVESETTRVGESAYSDRHLEEDPNLVRAGVRRGFKETVGGIVRAVEKLSWEGRIALVNGEKIYINAGRLSGIQVGDILKVSEEGNEVFDPDTGSFIGEAPGRMKGTVEVVSYFGKDGAITIVHSGSGFKENDKIELY